MPSTINASSSGSGGLISTGDASGVLQLQRNGTVSVGIDTNGFLLLPGTSGATTNSSTGTFNSGLQLGDNLQILNYSLGANTQCQFLSNAYYNGGYKYINTGAGTSKMYVGAAGIWEFAGAAIGTAGNAITYTATLGCNGLGYTVYLQGGASTEAGAGITFPASQSASSNANTLDDYEEGTWTPTIAFGGGTTGQSYAYQVGSYTKIGNRVFISMYVNFSNKGSSTGTATITGLPFTSASTSGLYNNAAIWINTMTGISGSVQAYNGPGTSTISELAYVGTGGQTIINNSNFTNGSDIMINFSYRVA